MSLGFASFAAREEAAFGLQPALVERLGRECGEGRALGEQLDDPEVRAAHLEPTHLLRLRRAWHRFAALSQEAGALEVPALDALAIRAARFGGRLGRDAAQRRELAGALAAYAAGLLARGRLRVHARRPSDRAPEAPPEEYAGLVEHTLGCAELAPHRWFTARRGEEDGWLTLELVAAEGEAERALGPLATPELHAELHKAGARAAREVLHARAEAQVLDTAAGALHALLARPPITGPVAGVVSDGQRLFAHLLGGEADGDSLELRPGELERLAGWIQARGARHAAVAAVGRGRDLSGLLRALSAAGLTVERVREAGLMKQARGQDQPLKAEAARVAARRLQDPLDGHRELRADELGLGEYLDQVDATRLHAALEDVRAAVTWERGHGRVASPAARGLEVHPMVHGLQDLRPGMELTGTVANLTHFGAFVELGLPVQGLVHLSELAERFVAHPSEVVAVGQRVRVRVLEVDEARGRLALSMRPPRDPRRQKQGAEKRGAALSALDQLFKK
ncbi:MAG TPA: S1 RNA-binding domain-containing protein [Myxococcota bacterium]|nr:S1 RNA-binding domain-containing protein [Myxococcota bacterium]HRY94741.1 S1 RNA-binding domain-containing protein [Myxococcota bacterium]HSA20036.1 S1 RNA-binding domain-containing protein [Myxococcota bacterium]